MLLSSVYTRVSKDSQGKLATLFFPHLEQDLGSLGKSKRHAHIIMVFLTSTTGFKFGGISFGSKY